MLAIYTTSNFSNRITSISITERGYSDNSHSCLAICPITGFFLIYLQRKTIFKVGIKSEGPEIEKNNWMEADIRYIGYTKEHETLQVKFHNRAAYEYFEFPPEELENFMNTDSRNEFFTRIIRRYYQYSRTVILIKFSLDGSFPLRVIT